MRNEVVSITVVSILILFNQISRYQTNADIKCKLNLKKTHRELQLCIPRESNKQLP